MNVSKKHLPVALLTLTVFLLTPTLAHAGVQSFIWGLVNNLFGMFVGWGGLLLNIGITDYVSGFGKAFTTEGLGATINILWGSVRDIFNLTFIFGLVYIGFKMILDSDDSGTRKWLINLIMAALLVNFSLFITKFVVDITNILAHTIAVQGFGVVNGTIQVSETFMSALGMPTIWGGDGAGKLPAALDGSSGGWGYIFGAAILYIVAAFVFATGGILLIIRYAVLSIYMVLSPLMFIGWVFPSLQSVTNQFWKGFLGRAFFAPVYVLLVYFASQIIITFYDGKTPDFRDSLSGVTASATAGSSFSDTIPPFILSCVFLIAAVVIGNKLGAVGAGTAISVGKNLRGYAQRGVGSATFGAGAAAARVTAGQIGSRYAQSDAGKARASRSFVGKQIFKAAQKTGGASFDARNVGGMGKSLGIGSGKTGGFTKQIEDSSKEKEKFADSIRTNANLNDPAVQVKIAEETQKIKSEADKQADVLQQQVDELKNVAERADDPQVEAELNDGIGALNTTIEKLTTSLSGKNLTKSDRTAAEKELARNKGLVSVKETSVKMVKERKEAKAKVAALEATASLPNASLKDRQALEDSRAKLAGIDSNFTSIQSNTVAQLSAVKSRSANASKEAEAGIKFANEIAYMKQLERSEKLWGGLNMNLAAATPSGLAGVVTTAGGVAALGGVSAGVGIGVGAMKAQSYANKAAREKLESKFGKNGMKGSENEANNKAAASIAKQLLEQGGSSVVPPAANA